MAGIDEQVAPIQTPAPVQHSQPSKVATHIFIGTPYRRSDLHSQLTDLATHDRHLSTRRLLFRKVEKAFDQKNSELAQLQQENEALKSQLEAARPSKRKKVVIDPNDMFASIEQIHQAQIDVGRIEDSTAEESGSESTESDASCIVVR